MEYEHIEVLAGQGDSKGVWIVKLNRPKKRNALNQRLVDELSQFFSNICQSEEVKAVVLTGNGKAFSAGVDLSDPVDAAQQASNAPTDLSHNPVHHMRQLPVPIIGAVNGIAATGGFELALACDLLIGSNHAAFVDTHCAVGVVPCWGLSQKLTRIIGPGRARLASLSASRIDSATALRWGLLTEVTRSEQLLERAVAIGDKISSLDTGVVRQYLKTLRDGFDLPFGEALQLERSRAEKQYGGLGQTGISDRTASFRAKLMKNASPQS